MPVASIITTEAMFGAVGILAVVLVIAAIGYWATGGDKREDSR